MHASTALQQFQSNLLSACGISQETGSMPSRKVLIVVRHPERILRNALQAVEACGNLGLSCGIFNASLLADPSLSDVCSILHHFDGNPLVVGLQGAELVYPLYRSLRLLLIRKNCKTAQNCKMARPVTERMGKCNVHQNDTVFPMQDSYWPPLGLAASDQCFEGDTDPWYPEMAYYLNARLAFIRGYSIEPTSQECVKNLGASHQHDEEFQCMDAELNLAEFREALQSFILDGELL
jgi:hypothetical protein